MRGLHNERSLGGKWKLAGLDPGGDRARVRRPYPISAPVPNGGDNHFRALPGETRRVAVRNVPQELVGKIGAASAFPWR